MENQRIPPSNPTCAPLMPLLEGYYDGALDPSDAHSVAAHLATCADCARRLDACRNVDSVVRNASLPSPPSAMRQRLYARIAVATASAAGPGLSAPASRAPSGRPVMRPAPSDHGPDMPHPPRRGAWLAAVAAAAVVVALATLFATLPRSGNELPGSQSTRIATAASTPTSLLPAFSDWRAAYLGADGKLHVATLDGRHNVSITALSSLDDRVNAAAVAPDGKTLAYIMSPKFGPIALMDLRASTPAGSAFKTVDIRASDLSWAPDSSLLVADGSVGSACGLFRISLAGKAVQVPGTDCNQTTGYNASSAVQGWLDATHALVNVPRAGLASVGATGEAPLDAQLPLSSGPLTLASLDVVTGVLRPISEPAGWAPWAVAPDGRTLLLTSIGCGIGCPQSPAKYALLDLATEQLRRLPAMDDLAPQGGAAIWAPDSGSLIIVPNAGTNDNAPVVRVDAATGVITQISTGYTPAGWAPDGRTLLVTTQASLHSANPIHTLYALGPVAPGTKPVAVANDVDLFLGLARTA